eukprot:1158397-Pelagomonas_calceolata.AAC.8
MHDTSQDKHIHTTPAGAWGCPLAFLTYMCSRAQEHTQIYRPTYVVQQRVDTCTRPVTVNACRGGRKQQQGACVPLLKEKRIFQLSSQGMAQWQTLTCNPRFADASQEMRCNGRFESVRGKQK